MKRVLKGILIFLLIIILAAGIALAVNYKMNQNVYITEYKYQNEKLPKSFDGFRIAVISDIHNSPYPDKFIEMLDAARPNMILFAGDMIQQPYTDLDNVVKIIESQSEKIPVYAVFGNHEASNGSEIKNEIVDTLKLAGAITLPNSSDIITEGLDSIRIIGLNDVGDEYVKEDDVNNMRKKVEDITAEDNDESFNILLYHRADMYPQLNDLPVDLILSGHMHGGIVRLPFVGGIIGKHGDYFPDYTSGVYQEGDTTMIVSRGCDYNLKKSRLFNPPDVVMVTLKK